MGNESGEWIIYGVEWDDPECIHTVDEAIEYINSVGFLPLFRNEIPGFSLEERTASEFWWSGDVERDPWEWREIIARRGDLAYGKFFDKKAGFISKEWLPYFVNYRRDGYDFDALWDDEKASLKQKKIMDLFLEEGSEDEFYSNNLKQKAGYGKDGDKGFDGIITGLQMQMYLCCRDFRQRKNKKGEYYGWRVAIYSTPERIFGYDFVTSAYSETATESGKRIAKHIMEIYPIATANQIKKLLGSIVGTTAERVKKEKKVDYPANLLKELNLGISSLSEDQMYGLEYAISTLKIEGQGFIEERFQNGKSYKEVGKVMGYSAQSSSKRCKRAVEHLKRPEIAVWIVEGFNGHLGEKNASVAAMKSEYIKQGNLKQATFLDQTPDVLVGISKSHAQMFFRAGFPVIGNIVELMESDGFWYDKVAGIGHETSKKIVWVFYREGFISKDVEAYKLATDRQYYREKWLERISK